MFRKTVPAYCNQQDDGSSSKALLHYNLRVVKAESQNGKTQIAPPPDTNIALSDS